MTSLYTIFRKSGSFEISSISGNEVQELSTPPLYYSHTHQSEDCVMGFLFSDAASASESKKFTEQSETDGLIIISDSRIDYRLSLADQLGVNRSEVGLLSDNRLILLAYLKWGSDCVKYLFGDFAFVIWNKFKKEMFCARDHFGCRPLFYMDHPDFFALASDISAFQLLPGIKLKLDEGYIVDAICSIYPKKCRSGFHKISRIEPAHCLIATVAEPWRSFRYWDLEVKEEFKGLTEVEAISGLRQHFIDAVAERTSSADPIGIELSGGLDSTAILSCLVKELKPGRDVYTFSIVDGTGNETTLIKHIYESLGILKGYLIGEENVLGGYSAIKGAVKTIQKPIIQGFSALSDALYEEAAQNGVKVLLSGFGGDEGVSNSGSGVLKELVKESEIHRLKDLISPNSQGKRALYFHLLIEYWKFQLAPWISGFKKNAKRKSLTRFFALEKSMFKTYRIPQRFREQVFFPNYPDERERQHFRMNHSYVSDRLEASYFNAGRFGIEYRYPFLDVKLVEYYYSLDSVHKYKFRMGRYAFRQAMEGIVSDKVRLRQDKSGVAIPNILKRVRKDKDAFRELITEGQRNNRFHYVDYVKLLGMLDFLEGDLKENQKFRPRAFISAISVLVLQKWQREGSIDIGIKC